MMKKAKLAPITSAVLDADCREMASVADKRTMLDVKGHAVTVREFHIFKTYCECRSYPETAKLADVNINTMYKMKNQDWWGELMVTFISSAQEELYLGLATEARVLKDAVISIWTGKLKEPKLASSIVKSAEVFSKMGKSFGNSYAEPLTQSRRDLFLIDNSTTVNNFKVDMSPFFHRFTKEEEDQYSRDGKPIERFVAEAKAIENKSVEDESGADLDITDDEAVKAYEMKDVEEEIDDWL